MSLQGTLRTLGIAEVLEFLANRGATGRLDISAESGAATYWMMRGEVAEVEFDFEREAGWDAAEATYYALAELEGTFHFDEDQIPEHGLETERVDSVLGRTAVIADGWSDVEVTIPTPDHWLSRSNRLDGSVTIEPAWWSAIEAIGAGRSSRHLASDLDMRALAASSMAADMARSGLIEVGEPRMAEPLDPEPKNDEVAEIASDTADSEASTSEEQGVAEIPSASEDEFDLFAQTSLPESQQETQPAPIVEQDEAEDVELDADPDPEAVAAALAEMSSWDLPGEVPDDEADVAWPAEVEDASTSPALEWEDSQADEPVSATLNTQIDVPSEPAVPVEALVAETPATEEIAPEDESGSDSDDDGWSSDHSRPAPSTPANISAAPAPPTDEQLLAPTPPPMPSTDLPAPFSDAPPASTVFESAPPAGEAFDPPVLTYAETTEPNSVATDTLGEMQELMGAADTDFGTDERSSVLKFLRRD